MAILPEIFIRKRFGGDPVVASAVICIAVAYLEAVS
jgi:hypothetical protein